MIEILHRAKTKKNLVLFIHGFIGSEKTWKKETYNPLIDYLIFDSAIKENFNIGLFVYHTELGSLFPKTNFLAKAILGKKAAINLPIDEIAKLLYSQLHISYRDYENVILIGHSMGGLVAKRFILDDIRENTDTKVKLYISLATPHSGSILATYSKLLIDNVQAIDLAPLSKSITEMNDAWIKSKALPKSMYAVGQYDKIVARESAIPYQSEKQNVVYSG